MQHIILSAPTEQQLIDALPEYRATDEDGNVHWTNIIGPCTRWISKPTYDEDGNQVTPGETEQAFTLIIYAEQAPEAARQFVTTNIASLEPLPAGGLQTPQVPQRVTALQGMLSVKAAGLVEAFITWKAALDPINDFEVIAFLEKAEYWDYNNPILDTALAALGAIEQKDALFINAATL